MHLGGWQSWADDLQLLLAGIAIMVAFDQLTLWRWEGRRSSARLIVGTALSATAVLVTNTILLRYLASGQLNLLVGLRTVFISALVLSTLPLAGAVASERPSRLWEAAIVAAVILRLTLWFGTHLVYGYSLTPTGLPRYGPLLVPTSLIVLALLFGYLTRVAMLGRTELERIVLAAGILGSAALGVVSVVSSSGLVAELLTGYLTLPSLVALAVLVRMRQDEARRAVGEYSSRQHALADLSRLALTAPLSEVRESVQASLVAHLPHVLAEQAMVALDDPRRPEPEWFDDPQGAARRGVRDIGQERVERRFRARAGHRRAVAPGESRRPNGSGEPASCPHGDHDGSRALGPRRGAQGRRRVLQSGPLQDGERRLWPRDR